MNARHINLDMDFFENAWIKHLRKVADGDKKIIIFLKMKIQAANDYASSPIIEYREFLRYEHIDSNFINEIALKINEKASDVKATIEYFIKAGFLELRKKDEDLGECLLFLSYSSGCTLFPKYRNSSAPVTEKKEVEDATSL